MTAQIGTKQLAHYSFIAFPLAFAGLPLYINAPDYYVRELGVSVGLLGVLLFGLRLVDALQDVLIGHISDKNTQYRSAIVKIGAALMVVGVCGVFMVPDAISYKVAWFALFMFLASFGFSTISINLNTIGGLWSNDYDERTRISGARESFNLIGLLLASLLPALLMLYFTAQTAFLMFSLLFSGLILLAAFVFMRFLKQYYQEPVPVLDSNKSRSLFQLSIRFKSFYGVFFLSNIASAIPAALIMFFVKDYLQLAEYIGLFLFLYFLSGALFMKLWVYVSYKVRKHNAWMFSMVLAVLTFICASFIQQGDLILYAVICVLSGAALGADLALPPSILADKITKAGDEETASKHYAVLSIIPKVSLAIGGGLTFLILDYVGFEAGADNSAKALVVLVGLYAIIPSLLKLTAALWLFVINKENGENNEVSKRSFGDGFTRIS